MLSRFVKDDTLWSCLAGMATNARHLETAEVAYSAIHEADKVHYIQYIKVSSEMLRSQNYAQMLSSGGREMRASRFCLGKYTKSWVNGAMDNGSKLFISSKCC